MKKTNKKGFTLVELLAVIVILGVLLMIAVPAIQNVIKKSKRNAFVDQAKLAVENVETMISVTDNVQMPDNSNSCEIKLKDIKLDRGSWTGYTGKVTVTKLASADENGKNYKVEISLSDGTNSLKAGTTKTTAPDPEYAKQDDATSTTCDWYTAE